MLGCGSQSPCDLRTKYKVINTNKIKIKTQSGEFSFDDVPIGDYLLTITHPSFATMKHPVTVTTQGAVLSLEMSPGAEIQGLVLDPEGQPLEGVRVACFQGKSRRRSLSDKTDANGSYRVRNVPEGSYRLLFSHSEYVTQAREVAVAGEESLRLDDVELPRGGTLEGEILFSNGRRPTLAVLLLEPHATGDTQTAVVRNGKFKKSGIPAGNYDIRFNRGLSQSLEQSVETDTQARITPGKTDYVTIEIPE